MRIGGFRWESGDLPEAHLDGMRAQLGAGGRMLVLDRCDRAPRARVWARGRASTDWAVSDADPDRLPPDASDGALAGHDGAWALAWTEGDAVCLARDPSGHRSLFVSAIPGGHVFASAIGPVVAFARPSLDLEQVAAFLSCAYVPGPGTLAAGVRAVEPGQRVSLTNGRVAGRRFWLLPPTPTTFPPDDALRLKLRRTLDDAVRRWAPAGPIGATLSGGVDSSAVLALAHAQGVGPLRAFSVTFGPEHADELEWSARVCAHLGLPRTVVTVRPEDVRDRFDETVAALSSPNGDPLTVPNTLLFEAAAAHGRALLNGEGGDPNFGGPKNAPMLLAELFDVEDAAEAARARATTWLDAHQRAWEHLPAWMPEGDLAATRLAERVAPWFADASRPGLLDRLMAINVAFKGAWHILPKVDSLGAPFDVAPRSPLFDRRVVELAFQVPARLKRFGAIEKHLFKEAIRDVLPAEVVERPKSGMMVPVEAWFNGPLKGWARERILGGLAPRGFLRRDALEDLLEGRRGGLRPRRGVKIWLLLTLEAWVRRVLDRGRDGART